MYNTSIKQYYNYCLNKTFKTCRQLRLQSLIDLSNLKHNYKESDFEFM